MGLQVYGGALSPYVAKIMIQIAAKGLDIPIVAPPGGTGSDEYKKLNPTGKIPALDVDGTIIPESAAIQTYLENTQAGASLLPNDFLESANVIALGQIVDLYVGENLAALFGQMNPKTRNEDVTRARLEALATGISRLNAVIAPGPYAHGGTLSLADCTIAPILFYVTQIIPTFGGGDPLADAPNVAAYWEAIQRDDHVVGVLDQMGKALAAMRAG